MSGRRLGTALSVSAVVLTVGFVVVNLRPGLWFVDTTPTGGDLGAHVWAPAYLRDVLLSELRLTGWTHDWYAGFPAFTFYMVVPSVLVVIFNAGIGLPLGFFAGLAAAGAGVGAVRVPPLRRALANTSTRQRILVSAVLAAAAVAVLQLSRLFDGRVLGLGPLGEVQYEQVLFDRAVGSLLLPVVAAGWAGTALRNRPAIRLIGSACIALLALLVVPLPYGVALKLVVVAGVVALPAAVWAMTRMAGVAVPGQVLASAATLLFLFDRSFNIYGGNLMSTMAGEFAYSLGLGAAILYIGAAARDMDSGRHGVLAGVLLALTGLLHLFAAFFALAVTAALLLVMPWRAPNWRRRIEWTAVTGMLAAALSAWWVLPFWWNRSLLNDMGWGKERRYVSSLWSRREFDYSFLTNDPPLQPFVLVAAATFLGFGAVKLRRAWRQRGDGEDSPTRPGIRPGTRLWVALVLTAVMFVLAFRLMPEGRLWNVRILPFYYLAVYLTAALGVGETIRCAVRAIDRRRAARREETTAPGRWPSAGSFVGGAAVIAAVAGVFVLVGLPLRALPGGSLQADGEYRWGPLSTREINLGPHWVQYNFEGYEGRPPTDAGGGSSEYWDLVDLMTRIGKNHGCGPALWEYEAGRLGSYGTPMSPMLLPYWTDRCIASMEGLYFEASATTPYHFLMQSELSAAPSRAQRDLPYGGLDVAAGVEHLRMTGVRYYMAFSEQAVRQARAAPGLSEVDASGPWVVFGVDGSEPVSGLAELPVVLEGVGNAEDDWLEPSVGAFLAGEDAPMLAADGPRSWPRMSVPPVADGADDSGGILGREEAMRRLAVALPAAAPRWAVEPAVVSDMVRRDHSISFSVDRVGSPVLVRTSYFPNWSVSGADGPYRVTPNFMVVVPSSTEVRLSYGRSPVEWFGIALLLAGVAAALLMHLHGRGRAFTRRVAQEPPSGIQVAEPVIEGSGLEGSGAEGSGPDRLAIGRSGPEGLVSEEPLADEPAEQP